MNSDYDPKLVEQFFHEYHDRGMVKWQGFYLSDHTSALGKKETNEKAKNNRHRGPQMDDAEVRDVINHAITKNQSIVIELLETTKNMVLPDVIQGMIEGHFGNKLVIGDKFVDINNIYSVELKKD